MSPRERPPATMVTRVISSAGQDESLQVRLAQLKVTKGPDKGSDLQLGHGGILVGTSTECDLVLSDASVSRKHFELLPEAEGYRLRDLGSKNGTLINGVRCREVLLQGGEDILTGHSRLRLTVGDKFEAYPLSAHSSFGPMLGRSPAMRQVFSVMERAASSDTTMLLEGESGTGKDVAAETIHSLSPRSGGPFVVVDCGSIQANLVGSELFGHLKGAFTGAERDRAGAFEAAQGGTVFLDEIGELEAAMQPQLLRMLESREIRRLGDNRYRPVDVRVIAATNKVLRAEVNQGRFREDLYYRLSVVKVRMPPLRERRDDIGMLAKGFVQKMRPEMDPDEVIHPRVMSMLANGEWPGNVRELRNAVERLLLFPENPEAAYATSGGTGEQGQRDLIKLPFHEARREWNEKFERMYLEAVLEISDGVVSRAAERAGIPRQTVHRLMRKLGLNKE